MRIQICNIFFILIVASCTNKVVEKPIWVNKADTVQIQESPLVFKAKTKNWQGLLQSFVQPIPLQLIHTDTGFLLKPLSKKGFIEGPSTIILKNEEQFFYYDMVISNNEVVKVMEDYRSPKTVNPDSSLEQQSIVHIIDANRNIVVEDERYFKEKIYRLGPKANTTRAIASEPITAHYVQPGSCVKILLKSELGKDKNEFEISTNILKDKDGNLIANGTLVTFTLTNAETVRQCEATLKNGQVSIVIPNTNKEYKVYAKIHSVISNTITLAP